MSHRTSTSAASNRVHRGGSLHISPLQSQTHSSKNYLILWLRISSPRCQVGRGEAKLEYDYIVVGVYMLFNRQSNCTGVLLDVPAHSYLSRLQVLSSLRAYLSTPQSLRISTRALSVRSPLPLSSSSITFSKHAALSRTFGKNLLDPHFVWDLRTIRKSGIQ